MLEGLKKKNIKMKNKKVKIEGEIEDRKPLTKYDVELVKVCKEIISNSKYSIDEIKLKLLTSLTS